MNHFHTLNTFALATMPDLDVAVLGALELFSSVSVPTVHADAYKRPLVVGSGNALTAGRIIFSDKDAVFASESDYERVLAGAPDRHILLPTDADYVAMVAVGYYTIGRIQKQHPPYFKEHIVEYARKAPAVFGDAITPIVE